MQKGAEGGWSRLLLVGALSLGACTGAGRGSAGAASTTADTPTHTRAQTGCAAPLVSDAQARLLVDAYCVSCHWPSGSAGEDLDFRDDATIRSRRRNIEAKLRLGMMPPPGAPMPSAAERSALRCWAGLGAD